MAFSFYKVSIIPYTELWFLGVRFLWASGHIISTNWSTSNLLLCVFLFKDTFFNMYCWFVNIEFMANSAKTHIWRKCICIFFVRYIIAFLHLGTLDSTSALLQTVKSPAANKNVEKCGTIYATKKTSFYHVRAETRGRKMT